MNQSATIGTALFLILGLAGGLAQATGFQWDRLDEPQVIISDWADGGVKFAYHHEPGTKINEAFFGCEYEDALDIAVNPMETSSADVSIDHQPTGITMTVSIMESSTPSIVTEMVSTQSQIEPSLSRLVSFDLPLANLDTEQYQILTLPGYAQRAMVTREEGVELAMVAGRVVR